MEKFSWTGKLLIAAVAAQLMLAPLAGAQDFTPPPSEKPVMENVFFNVVWGSLVGTLLALSLTVIEADSPTAPDESGRAAFEGATAGGIIGLATGLFLVATGATFDPDGALLFGKRDPDPFGDSVASQSRASQSGAPQPLPPRLVTLPLGSLIALETASSGSFRISGIRATVFDLKF